MFKSILSGTEPEMRVNSSQKLLEVIPREGSFPRPNVME